MAEVVRLMDVRAAQRQSRQASCKGIRMASPKAPHPAQLFWHGSAYFFVGCGFTMMFASWMAREMTSACFTAAAYCDQRSER